MNLYIPRSVQDEIYSYMNWTTLYYCEDTSDRLWEQQCRKFDFQKRTGPYRDYFLENIVSRRRHDIPSYMWHDNQFVWHSIQTLHNINILPLVPDKLKTFELMKIAVECSSWAFQYSPSSMKVDSKIIHSLIEKSVDILQYVDQNFIIQNILSLVKVNAESIRFLYIPRKNTMIEAIKINPESLCYMNKYYQQNHEIVFEACKNGGWIDHFVIPVYKGWYTCHRLASVCQQGTTALLNYIEKKGYKMVYEGMGSYPRGGCDRCQDYGDCSACCSDEYFQGLFPGFDDELSYNDDTFDEYLNDTSFENESFEQHSSYNDDTFNEYLNDTPFDIDDYPSENFNTKIRNFHIVQNQTFQDYSPDRLEKSKDDLSDVMDMPGGITDTPRYIISQNQSDSQDYNEDYYEECYYHDYMFYTEETELKLDGIVYEKLPDGKCKKSYRYFRLT